jgi:hypothetical protein
MNSVNIDYLAGGIIMMLDNHLIILSKVHLTNVLSISVVNLHFNDFHTTTSAKDIK